MRKKILLILAIILACSLSMTAYANESKYKNAAELYAFWVNFGFPDYICGVWSTDGSSENLTFAVQNTRDGNAGKQEILNLVEDDSTVSFAYQKYSLNYLHEISENWWKYAEHSEEWFVGCGTLEMDNVFEITVLREGIYTRSFKKTVRKLTKEYGNAIVYRVADSRPVDSSLSNTPFSNDLYSGNYFTMIWTKDLTNVTGTELLLRTSPTIPCLIVFGGFSILVLAFLILKKKKLILINVKGKNMQKDNTSLSSKEVEQMITHSQISVSSDLDEKVMASINKKTSS